MNTPNLFDDPPAPADCARGCDEVKTETDWGEPWGWRMTWTCRRCGKIRGRA